jgi:Tfp pilus assembly protein PilE
VRGFTLLEVPAIVVIIGLLPSLVAPRYFGQVGKTRPSDGRPGGNREAADITNR